jgi:hypothetical protein
MQGSLPRSPKSDTVKLCPVADHFAEIAADQRRDDHKASMLLVIGDGDVIRTSHAVGFFELLGGDRHDANGDASGLGSTRLAILPGVAHCTIFSSPVPAVVPFLDGTMLTGKAQMLCVMEASEDPPFPAFISLSAQRCRQPMPDVRLGLALPRAEAIRPRLRHFVEAIAPLVERFSRPF